MRAVRLIPAASGNAWASRDAHECGEQPPDAQTSAPPDIELTAPPDIELTLPARAENVAVVRHALGGLGDALGLGEELMTDVSLAVTEACANVVVHAYEGREGPLEVAASVSGERITVVVRDHGAGITPHPGNPGLGVGLPLMATLSDVLELRHGSDGATEVRMTFELRDGAGRPLADGRGATAERLPAP